MAFNANICKLIRITYHKSTVIKYMCNMYEANALSDNIYLAFALVAEKHLGFFSANHRFYSHEETQDESYLGVIIVNKLRFNLRSDDMSEKATNLLSLSHCSLHT